MLNLFGGKIAGARRGYLEFMKKGGCGGTPTRFNRRGVGAKRRRMIWFENHAQSRETASEPVTRGRQIVEEQGLRLLDEGIE